MSSLNAEALQLVPMSLVIELSAVDEGRGQERYYATRAPKRLEELRRSAKIESSIASNAIEGVVVPRQEAEAVLGGTQEPDPERRGALELAGYQAALDDLYESPVEELTVPRLLGWHRALFAHDGPDIAGRLKVHENRVTDRLADGQIVDRFQTVSAAETSYALDHLCGEFERLAAGGGHHPVVLVAAAVLDLLIIHPFEDGNGRVARILTTALTERFGYRVGRYQSLERVVSRRQSEYYQALLLSTAGWHEGSNSVWPWATFLAKCLADAYRELDVAARGGGDIRNRIVEWVGSEAPARFAMSVARERFPDASADSIRSALNDLRAQGLLRLEGVGRGARWVKA